MLYFVSWWGDTMKPWGNAAVHLISYVVKTGFQTDLMTLGNNFVRNMKEA